MKKNFIATVLGTALLVGSLTGCGEATTASANASEAKAEESTATQESTSTEEVADQAEAVEVTTIKAATGGGPKPYVYVGEDD